jgi:hypothetical protein
MSFARTKTRPQSDRFAQWTRGPRVDVRIGVIERDQRFRPVRGGPSEAVMTSGAEQYRRLAREFHFLDRDIPLGEHRSALLKLAEEWDKVSRSAKARSDRRKRKPLELRRAPPGSEGRHENPARKGLRTGNVVSHFTLRCLSKK